MSTSPGSRDYGRFDELAEEFAERYRRGERPSLQEYVDRLPAMAAEIREMFPALVEVEQAEGDAPGNLHRPPLAAPSLRQVGDYRIVRELGRGGMGVVYEAEQLSLGRHVALKVLPAYVAGDRKTLQRFRREAKAAAGLHHTNIVPVFEVGQERDVAFYAMQFIQGQGLDQVIEELKRLRDPDPKTEGRNPGGMGIQANNGNTRGNAGTVAVEPLGFQIGRVAESLLSGRLATDGLELESPTQAIGAGIGPPATDRFEPDESSGPPTQDRRPDRTAARPATDGSGSAVLPGGTPVSSVEPSGRRPAFFRSVAQIGRQAAHGLAYAHARGIVHRDVKPSNLLLDTAGIVWITDFGLAKAEDDGLTATGDILGTLRYMAPERFRGEGDARADIYALGLTLYELLTLRPAYHSSDRLKLIERIKSEEPARPRSLDSRIPRDLETIVLKSIDKDPERRYPTATAMAEDLRRFLADEPILARRAPAAERYWRWARRNPLTAVLGGVLTGILVIVTIGSLLAAGRFARMATRERETATAERSARGEADRANTGLRASQEELRRTVYTTRSNLALAAWDTNDVVRLHSLLDLMRPPRGEPDLRGWEWRYLWQLVSEERLTLRARDDDFADVVFSPDGQTLAGLERNGRVQLWDRLTGGSRRTIGAPNSGRLADLGGGVSSLAFSPDGRSLAAPGPNASLMLYAVESGLPTLSFEGSPGAVQDLAWSPDGHTLVAALSAHVMRVWDARDGHVIHKNFGGHNGPVAAVAFSPDGRTLVSASFDRTVKLWNRDDPARPRAVLKGHTDEVRAVAFSPDGLRVASASLDQTIRVWDARSAAVLSVIRGHTGAVTALAYGPDNSKVVTGSADQTVRVWDTASGQELRIFKGHTDEVRAVVFSTDGNDVASASSDATVRVWDATSPPRPRTLQSPSVLTYGGGVECLAFSRDGRRLVSGHDDHAVRVWELAPGRPPLVVQGHMERIVCVAFSPDGLTIASGSEDATVRLWDAATGQPGRLFTGHSDSIGAVVFAPDGQTILSGGRDGTIQAWDPATGVVRSVFRGHFDSVNALAITADGRTLASASADKTAILWDLPTGQPRVILRGHTDRINSVAFSQDGRTVATSSRDHTVRLWDTATGAPRGVLEGHVDEVDGIAFSPDGRLASSGHDKTIRVWDPTSGQTLLVLKGHASRIGCVGFSPDGRTLASASHDRTLKLWEAAPEAALAAPHNSPAPESSADPASSRLCSLREALRPIQYATSSNLALAAWEADDVVRLRYLLDLMKPRQDETDLRGWEWHYLNRLAHQVRSPFQGPDREVGQAAFSPDGQTLATVHRGGRVRLWDPTTGQIRLTLQPEPPTKDLTQSGVSGLAFSPDGERLAGPGPDANLGIWNTRTGALLRQFSVSSHASLAVAFSPDGKSVVTGSASRKVRIWDTSNGRLLRLFENAHDDTVERVVYSPDGRRVASTAAGAIKLWDVEAGKLHATLPAPKVPIFAFAFSPDSHTLATGGSDHVVRLWDADAGRERRQLSGHAATVTALAFRNEGRQLQSAGADGVVILWDVASGRPLSTVQGQAGPVRWDAFRPDGKTLASSGFDRMMKQWEASHPPEPLVLKMAPAPETGASSTCVAYSLDTGRIAAGYTDHNVRVWDTATARVQWTLTGHEQAVNCVAFSPDGQLVASGADDKMVRLWDASTGQPRARLTSHEGGVESVAFRLDGRRLVSSRKDGSLKLWDTRSSQCLLTIPGQSGAIPVARYSPDGQTIASAGLDGRIRLWSAESGQLLATLSGHSDRVTDLAWSPDGAAIASSSADKTVMLWEPASGRPLRTLKGHTARVNGVAFSPDGRRLVSAGRDQTLRLWDPASGQDLLTLRGHSSPFRSVAFRADGLQIASSAADGSVIVWDAGPVQALKRVTR